MSIYFAKILQGDDMANEVSSISLIALKLIYKGWLNLQCDIKKEGKLKCLPSFLSVIFLTDINRAMKKRILHYVYALSLIPESMQACQRYVGRHLL